MHQSLKPSRSTLCASCRALFLLSRRTSCRLPQSRHMSSAFNPGKVLVVYKTSRLDFERKNGNVTDRELQSKLSEIGSDYHNLLQRHTAHHRSLDEILSFLEGEGIPLRVRNRETLTTIDISWADTIFSAGGDGNFLFTASKVITASKLVVGLNTDPRSSEGYLCLPSCPEQSIKDTLRQVFKGEIPQSQRTRIRVCIGEDTVPVRALNEVFIGEKCLSHVSYYELSCDETTPEKQKSSGVLVYTGTGSTSWAYNRNQLTVSEVNTLMSLARKEGLLSTYSEEQITKITDTYNAGNIFGGADKKMAFVVREPIVRGLFAACKTRGFAQCVSVRSHNWNACVVIDGQFQYDFPRGVVATCLLSSEDLLTTLDTTRTFDCFS